MQPVQHLLLLMKFNVYLSSVCTYSIPHSSFSTSFPPSSTTEALVVAFQTYRGATPVGAIDMVQPSLSTGQFVNQLCTKNNGGDYW